MSDGSLPRVKRIIAAYKEISVDSVGDDARLIEDLDIDSLGATEIAFDLEEEFQISIGEEVRVDFVTVRDVARRVGALLGGRSGS